MKLFWIEPKHRGFNIYFIMINFIVIKYSWRIVKK